MSKIGHKFAKRLQLNAWTTIRDGTWAPPASDTGAALFQVSTSTDLLNAFPIMSNRNADTI